MAYTNVVCQKYLDSILIQKKSVSDHSPSHTFSTLCHDVIIMQTILLGGGGWMQCWLLVISKAIVYFSFSRVETS